MTSDFKSFGLHQTLEQSLERIFFKEPTPIQKDSIPHALEGKDILASAQTGTGKTGAYAIPAINMLLNNPVGNVLVLAPTRELAQQILTNMTSMLHPKSGIKTALLIGGDSMAKQLTQLRANPRIVVGTPGRINDHLARRTLKLNETGFLVLDETDRMLDMGFGPQLENIAKHLPKTRQTLMFSATLPTNIVKLSKQYLTDPVRISMGESNTIAQNIQQEVVKIHEEKKYDELKKQLEARTGSVIVFMKTKYGAEKMARKLDDEGYEAEAIHGDLKQSKRDRVIRDFRAMKYRVLVATDVAARGLDIPHIEHVINYHLPQVPEDYIHRLGRTARAGASGSSVCFVSAQENRQWVAIERMLNPELAKSAPFRDGPRNNNGPRSKSKPNLRNNKQARPFSKDRPRDSRDDGPKKPYFGKPSTDGGAPKKSYGNSSAPRKASAGRSSY